MTISYPCKELKAKDAYKNSNLLLTKTIKKLESSLLKSTNKKLKRIKLNFKSNFKKEDFYKIVKSAKKYIQDGDIFQVVPSQDLNQNIL